MQLRGWAVRRLDRSGSGPDVVSRVVRSCSAAALGERFFLPGPIDPEEVLARYLRYLLVEPPAGSTVAGFVDGRPVGLATAVVMDETSADVAVLVADGWRRHGVGAALLGAALAATTRGTAHVEIMVGNAASSALLAHFARGRRTRLLSMSRGELEYAILPPEHVPLPA
jgi:GNAT superfamily N-acetyltransferase